MRYVYARGGAASIRGDNRGGLAKFWDRFAPGPNANYKTKLDWEFMRIAAPGTHIYLS